MSLPDSRPPLLAPLEQHSLDADPLVQFRRWYDEAMAAGLIEPTAMSLATADAAGNPSVRIVLLKAFGDHGFEFHTNYESRKGRELEARPRAACAMWWPPLQRQVRVEGRVERTVPEASDRYFRTRAPGSRLSAIASPQSRVVESREALEDLRARVAAEYPDGDPPRPAFWGGYRVIPERIEFWQMGRDRLHDRFLYTRDGGGWKIERLAP